MDFNRKVRNEKQNRINRAAQGRNSSAARRASGRSASDPNRQARRNANAAPGRNDASAGRSERIRRSGRNAEARTRMPASAGSRKRAAGTASRKRSAVSKERQMRVLRQRLIVAGGILVALVLWYCLTANSYRRRFLPHTYINGFDVSRMSVADAEAILKNSVEKYTLELGFRGGSNETVTSRDVDLTYVSSNEVEQILADQNRAGWIRNAFGKHSTYTVSTSFKFDSAKMRSYLESLPEFLEANITKPKDAYIVKRADNTFMVASETEGNEPVEDAVFEAVNQAINHSEARLNLAAVDGAYASPSVRRDDEDLNYTVERFNSFVNTTIRITMKDGSVETYGRDQLIDWFAQDESTGVYSLSKESVYNQCYAVMQSIADRYDNTKSTVEYESLKNGTVVLPCAYYGYKVDVEDETDLMYEGLINREDTDIEIVNGVKETMDPTNGGTYVEVDVTNQYVTFVKDGEVFLGTDCVTGLESDPERRTPSGVFSVLNLMENQVLGSLTSVDPGQRYESHVDYWMPFFESYGMHDASWRDEDAFGGEIYLYYGSHGCVNLPPSSAERIYKNIDYYTPVIVVRAGDNAPDGTKRGNTTWNPPEGGLHYSESESE